jgi:hypothetical protein
LFVASGSTPEALRTLHDVPESTQDASARSLRRVTSACIVLAAIFGLTVGCDPADSSTASGSEGQAAAGVPTATRSARPPADPMPAATAGTPTSQTTSFIPTRLTLPSGRVAVVDPAGVGADGVLQVPADAGRVGWWTGGARVGEPFGSIVVAGHVDSRDYGIGILSELLTARIGDELRLDDGTDSRRFQVSAITQAPKARLAAATEAFRQDIDNRLVLITCVGAYDYRAGAYPDNLVVIADEIEE